MLLRRFYVQENMKGEFEHVLVTVWRFPWLWLMRNILDSAGTAEEG